ncbi:uncharacterized protein [Drosophila kikkawai]|uniref:PHD-type domain-containing protein n=1 Tax=Drosophila kikkawai TaxID=30033 RepID=A0ABM4GQG8_DROKI
MATCCFPKCPNGQKIFSRHVTVYCWLCDNIAHIGCADLGQNGSRITDRIRENPGLDWTCPSCLHIKSDMRVFMRQTHLEFQSLAAGFKELSTRFQKAEHHFKSLKLLNPECPLCSSPHVPSLQPWITALVMMQHRSQLLWLKILSGRWISSLSTLSRRPHCTLQPLLKLLHQSPFSEGAKPPCSRSPGCRLFSLRLDMGMANDAARWLVWARSRSLYRLECLLICSLTGSILRSLAMSAFLANQGAFVIVRSARFWTLCTFITLESDAVPHIWMQ